MNQCSKKIVVILCVLIAVVLSACNSKENEKEALETDASCTYAPFVKDDTDTVSQEPDHYDIKNTDIAGNVIFEFDREYTDEWGYIEVCFGLKDEEGTPLTGVSCFLSVDGDAVIKSPQVADSYGPVQEIETDEEGKAEFLILSSGHGDSILVLKIETEDGDVIEKEIYCIDPVKDVPKTPKVSILHESDNVDLNWEYQADAEEFIIERKVDNGTYQKYGSRVTTSFRDTEIKSGHIYFYRVYARNYLGYSEKTEEFCVEHVAPMENLGKLIVDQTDVITGESSTLTFQITPDYILLPGQGIELVVYDGNEIVGKTVLLDDGAVSNGDTMWRDGIYTGKITIMENEAKELLFRAAAEINFCGKKQVIYSANDVRVNVFNQLTEDDVLDFFDVLRFLSVLRKSERLLSSSMEDDNEESAAQTVLNYLCSCKNVAKAGISENGSIWFIMDSGIMGTLPIAPKGTMGK